MTENEVAKIVVDAAFKIHTTIGPGLLESVYESILIYELKNRGLSVQNQMLLPITYETLRLEDAFRIDLLVEEKVIVEIKSVEELAIVHKKQVLTYLKLSGIKLGVLINFNEALIKNGISRIINGVLE